ncbi:MAG: glycerol kinase GlpK, partial [Candidatus Competibacteraceae bacterium]|nr:glycerol kinase GlpK [Candidatus Competibacteraceae bacterium]
MSNPSILAIDQGTTSTRAMIFDPAGGVLAKAQQEFSQIYPQGGWVEHDPEEIWRSTVEVCRKAVLETNTEVVAIGITNQRETTVVWERASGKPIYNAIVWQDRRTAEVCADLFEEGHETRVTKRTGLLLDPYFSATKAAWILDHVEGARARAEAGELAFGTIDSFLLWRLTGGKSHATDATNACRTLLFNIHDQDWDPQMLELFRVPREMMPEIKDCAADFGQTERELFGRSIPIGGIAGDQQAALIGQACVDKGMLKSTYGTGCFVVLNTGSEAVRSHNRLLTTVSYRLEGRPTFAMEGSIFVAGSAVQWLRDGIKIIQSASETEALVKNTTSNKGVYLVPAFTGLGAPHWDPHARGAVLGMTRDTGPAEFVRATLEAVCYQTRDLLVAMANDGAVSPKTLRVDGGMVGNAWLLQFLSDLIDVPVERPRVTETTALGAAFLAGL